MTLKEAQAEYLIRGRNAMETAVVLAEQLGRGLKGKPIMELSCVAEVIGILNENGIRYAVIGGVAVSHQGVPRATQDLDLIILTEDIQKVHSLFREHYVKGTAIARVYDYHGTHFDVQPANLRAQQRVIARAEDAVIESVPTKVASVKDLLLLKFWSAPERPAPGKRMRDQADIAELLELHKDEITAADITDICDNLRALCYTREEEEKRKRAIEWLNATLEELGMSDRKYEWK